MEVVKLFRQAKKPVFIAITIFFILLFIGFIVFILCNGWFCKITLVDSVSPIEIINVFLTAFIAIWLGRYVTKKLTEQRFIKEFVIADIYKIEESLSALERLTLADKLDTNTTFQSLQIIRAKIEILQRTTEIVDVGSPEVAKLLTLHTQIYNITTDADGSEVDIASRKEEIQNLYNKFIMLLREIICHINKHS